MPTTPSESDGTPAPAAPDTDARKPYETPRLIDYGPISKLTQGGGLTTTDGASMKRQCL
jgi:hypothetical protein